MSAKIKCKRCNEILESKHRHDFVACGCLDETNGERGCYIDGGGDPYVRYGGCLNDILVYNDEKNIWENFKND